MPSSSDTGVSDTLDPLAIVSDDEILSESEVYTSDTTSTDEDDFQPFALPEFGDDIPIADGPFDGDLPLLQVPAPLLLAAVPLEDLPHDEFAVDDIDLFLEGPPDGDQDGVALMDADVPFADDPVVDPVDPLVEIPANVPIADPVIPPEVEFLPDEPAPFGPEPVVAYDPIEAPAVAPLPDPLPEPGHVDMPDIAPPVIVTPVELPPIPDAHVNDATIVAPVVPVSAAVHADHALFASHIDPRYADTRNGWIEDDDYPPFVLPVTPPVAPVSAPSEIPLFHPHTSDIHRTDLPITFLQDIPPPRPREGSSS
ncbi:hypothetical protein HanIR_Chr04g0180651 [Helianthus annuus]|nr:hypothetical protein HanIR_Chr04g0180651 [Helianthus annuus]